MSKLTHPHDLYQIHSEGLALAAHVVGPDAGLDLTDVGLVEEHHAKTALSDTTAYGERQTVVEQLLVEEELFALFLALNLQLTQQTLLVDTDTHRREFERTAQDGIPDEDVAIEALAAVFCDG